MTYSSGGLIQATDYNGFVTSTAGANVNDLWGGGSGDKGWGQTGLNTVATGGTVTATQWASLVNTIASMGAQTNTAITARTAPTSGTVISILAALNTDLTNITTNRNNAVGTGAQFTGWTGTNSLTAGVGGGAFTRTFTNTVTFASAAAARYFFNGGGRIKIDFSKTSTGNLGDPEWNDLANTLCGDIWFTGAAASKTIAGVAYTGTTKVGGTGVPNVLSTGTGFYSLTPGAAAVTIYRQYADTAPYTSNYIQLTVSLDASSSVLTFSAAWVQADADPISGGTASSGATPGTAATTICTYFPPSTTYLTSASWGTPSISASVA